MYLPKLILYDVSSDTISEFKGINKKKACKENEFFETLNLSDSEYPLLHTIPTRYRVKTLDRNDAKKLKTFYNNGLGLIYLWDDHAELYHEDRMIKEFNADTDLTSQNVLNFNQKTLMIKGSSAYEFDPITNEFNEMGYTLEVEAAHTDAQNEEKTLRISLVYEDMTEIGDFSSGAEDSEFPVEAKVNDCFAKYLTFYRKIYDNSTDNTKDQWKVLSTMRLRLNIGESFRKFKAGDYIRLKNFKYWNWAIRSFSDLDRYIRIDDIDDKGRYITEPIDIFNDMAVILTKKEFPSNDISGYNKPIIDNMGNDLYILEGEISACMPELDFICTGANRVWGCNNTERQIFSCELGNARNWNVFDGISSDSYAVTIASQGEFTACCNYLGTPVFFKENEMIVINGNKPSSYQVNSYSYRGVSADSPEGVCVVNDILYYKSSDGIYAYDGSRPICISDPLGNEGRRLCRVLLSGEGERLFVVGEVEGQIYHYVYDTKRNIWHKYSSDNTYGFLKYSDATLELCGNSDEIYFCTLYNGIPKEFSCSNKSEIEKEWFWESGDIYYNTPDRKYIGRIRIDIECTGSSELLISYNGENFKRIEHFPAHPRGSCDITLFPYRCDYFRIRMQGVGDMTLYTITKEVEEARENG